MSSPYYLHTLLMRRRVETFSVLADDPPSTFCLTTREVFWLTAVPVGVLIGVAAFVWWCLT